ncbi:MAG: hypothetical protein KJ607_12985 [Bacteroidetes bacterium]|nr:hypothetical protein [Bacteroidota bacterium]
MESILKYLSLIIATAVKFGFSVPAGIAVCKLTFTESFIIAVIGGTTGTLFFGYLTKSSRFVWARFLGGTKFDRKLNAVSNVICRRKRLKNKKKFTWKNKLIVKTKLYYGIYGIAFLTPCVLSIPFGTIIAVRFCPNLRKTFIILIASVIFWAFVLTLAFYRLSDI